MFDVCIMFPSPFIYQRVLNYIPTMGISPFAQFIRDPKVKSALKGLPIVKRGKKSGEMYRALSVADKAALVKRANAAPAFKRTKVAKSVLIVARSRKVPVGLVKKHWHSTAGTTVLSRLRKIAESNKLTLRSLKPKAAKVVKVAKKATKVAAKKATKVAKKATKAKKVVAKKVSKKVSKK